MGFDRVGIRIEFVMEEGEREWEEGKGEGHRVLLMLLLLLMMGIGCVEAREEWQRRSVAVWFAGNLQIVVDCC